MLLTNLGENLLVDFTRGQAMGLAPNLGIGLMTSVDDTGGTEAAWSGYNRLAVPRSLTSWAGTQGAGSTTASTGTSHQTSNNAAWSFGNAGVALTVVALGVYTGNNLIAWIPLAAPISYAGGDPVRFEIGSSVISLGVTGGLSDYAANKLIDHIFRGVAFTWPANVVVRLMTTSPSNSGGGTEVAPGGGYEAQTVPSTMSDWSGTQGAGTTTASTGTSGRTSNNSPIIYPSPTSSWGSVQFVAVTDSAGAGANLLYWRAMDAVRTIMGGGPAPRFSADNLSITFS